jgi:endonuclease V-like protein UPF0215 family
VTPGGRTLGLAESFRATNTQSTIAGVVARSDNRVDGAAFSTCTVGGLDATTATTDCWDRLDRPDVRRLLIAGIAPAWFNVLDLSAIHEHVERPVLSVSFAASEGLADAIEREFDGDARDRRLEIYERQPPRERVTVGGETLFVRAVGVESETARQVVSAVTLDGGRPEPVRVARQLARAADAWRATGGNDETVDG